MSIINNLKQNYEKFQIRGAIKEIMKNYGLRAISLKNYFEFLEIEPTIENVHSIKYDIMNGYINVYKYKENDSKEKCGDVYDTVTNTQYKQIYEVVDSIIKNEQNIPYKKRKNILVKISR